jgi:hypothetical protein
LPGRRRRNNIAEKLESDKAEAQEAGLFDVLRLLEEGSGFAEERFDAATIARLEKRLLEIYSMQKAKLLPAQRVEGTAWMWEESYQGPRGIAGLVLDILGYFSSPEVEAELRQALHYGDPKLKLFAVVSLLRLGKQVEPRYVFEVAANADMRNWLHDRLEELGRLDLFPPALRTQEALAESNMVSWLTYPTELGREPDEIELMKVESFDSGRPDGVLDYYIFRFRTYPPHWAAKNGWMAGVAGPFLRKEAPTTHSYGDTFSKFEPWDSKTPEEHIEGILELVQEWWEKHDTEQNRTPN